MQMRTKQQTLIIALAAIMSMPITIWAQDARWGSSKNSLTGSGTLAEAISAAGIGNASYIQLQKSITAETGYTIAKGVFTIDLNGYELVSTGSVDYPLSVENEGTILTLIDASESSGKIHTEAYTAAISVAYGAEVNIQGGSYESSAAAVQISASLPGFEAGTVTITGGFFTGASSIIDNSGNLFISSGTFTCSQYGNTAVHAGPNSVSTVITGGTFTKGLNGSFQYSGGILDLSGYPTNLIEEITVSSAVSNVTPSEETIKLPTGYCFYYRDEAIAVLSRGKYTIGEAPGELHTITYSAGEGTGEMDPVFCYNTHTLLSCAFTAPASKQFKAWSVDGQEYQPNEKIAITANTTVTAVWAVPYTISFDANGGMGEIESQTTLASYILPECTFTAPANKQFKAWSVNSQEYQPGDEIVVSSNTVVLAVWTDYVPKIIIQMIDDYGDGWNGNSIRVVCDGVELGLATIENGGDEDPVTTTFDYDPTCEYCFYWIDDDYSEECSFNISIEGDEEPLYTATMEACEALEDGRLFYTLEQKESATKASEVIVDNSDLTEYAAKLTEVSTLTYTRTLNETKWNALYVPFEIPVSVLTDRYDVACIDRLENDGEHLVMVIEKLSAGALNPNTPYFIRAKEETYKELSVELTDVILYKTEEKSYSYTSAGTTVTIYGTYRSMSSEELIGCYAISTKGMWQPAAAGTVLRPFRTYLKMSTANGSPAKAIRIRAEGEATAIENDTMHDSTEESELIYDLQGRRVDNPRKGMYIVNGKKVLY